VVSRYLLVLGYVGAFAWIAYEAQPPAVPSATPGTVSTVATARLTLPKTTIDDIERYAALVERPPFVPGRRPTGGAGGESADAADGETASPGLTKTRLSAIVVNNNNITALVENGDGSTQRLAKGGSFEGWTVEDIRYDRVVLTLNDQRRDLRVHRFEAPPPRTARPRAAPGRPPSERPARRTRVEQEATR
jgi:hypothetical protein